MLYATSQPIALETTMLTLYNNAYSTCSQKVRLVLAEKSLEWGDQQINFSKNEHITPEYLKRIGMIQTVPPASADLPLLLRTAMDKIAFLPFGLLVDSNDLPMEPINVVTEDPKKENIIYVGTDNGLYVSFTMGKIFMRLDNNLPRVPVHDMAVQQRENELVIATHGRSIYIAKLKDIHKVYDKLYEK